MKKLQDKVAIITGASKGIGEGIAKVFASYGAKLALIARGSEIDTLAAKLESEGAEVIAIKADVSNAKDVAEMVEKTIARFGKIDILVNNAGVCILNDLLTCPDKERDLHIDINLKGVWNVTKAVLPYMIKANKGKIVVMSSVTGDMVADPGEVAYAMTKSALVGFTKATAREVASYGINVNAICPGYVRTPLVEGMAQQSCPENPESVIDGIASSVPLGRLANPKEIGELAAFLSCDESSYITGTQMVIDGGSTLPETSQMGV